MNKTNYKIAILCRTYNHKHYIQEALKGFAMQKTDFPFVAFVTDDCSTDNEQEVILSFAQKELDMAYAEKEETEDYTRIIAKHLINKNCTFVFFLLKYNHHQIKKSTSLYLNDFLTLDMYLAICEGDDYWTVPYKLQNQVAFLDSHPDYTMTCHRVKCYSETKKKFVREDFCYMKSRDIKVKDIIYRTGIFIPTCSIVFRRRVYVNYPKYCIECLVGDYPLQIRCAMLGKTYYFNEPMGVYRVEDKNSWTGKQQWNGYSEQRVKVIRSQVNMFKGFANDHPQWRKIFHRKEIDQIIRFFPRNWATSKEDQKKYYEAFSEELKNLTFLEKLDLKIRMCDNSYIKGLYYKLYLYRFSPKTKVYE